MKMKTLVLLLVTHLVNICALSAQSAGVLNNGATIVVKSGAFLKVLGGSDASVSIADDGVLQGDIVLEGTIYLEGNWANNSTAINVLEGATGTVVFTGATPVIKGNSKTHFKNVAAANDLTLEKDVNLRGGLSMGSASIILGDNDLTVSDGGTIDFTSGWVKTTGTGTLTMPVANDNTPVVFPVGQASYTPIAVTQSATGSAGNFSVRVHDNVLENGVMGDPVSLPRVNKTWQVGSDASVIDVSFTMYWNAADESASFDRDRSYVSHYTGGAWDANSAASASGLGPFFTTRSGITSLSPFSVLGEEEVLPVEFIDVWIEEKGRKTVLNWSTAWEENNDYFSVEESTDGVYFDAIAELDGSGSTQGINRYDSPLSPKPGLSTYYRVRQTDFDGKYSFSKTVRYNNADLHQAELKVHNVNFDKQGQSLAFDVFAADNDQAYLALFETGGNVLAESSIYLHEGQQHITLPISTDLMSATMYILKILDGRAEKTVKFVLK
ncbi:hypothetical protein [uncultured Imperialibacter sp.]|uniref:hypothetical protein n=1 Tax=uncultured Imperialibacter sp. TaxID=1672639 RepID=UPI0030DA5C26|tara:strand:+ start:6474 stop:7961 length:1488 start_codon:yes stop_codon:yes gene_type:complete